MSASRSSRLDALVVALAARLVPSPRRDDWRREWLAELAHGAHGRLSMSGRWMVCARDALELRRLAAPRRPGREASVMDGVLHDLRIAHRALLRAPGLAVSIVVVLALGIGANTTIFSVVHGILLQPLPFDEPSELVAVWETSTSDPSRVAIANYRDWRRQAESFEEMAVLGNSGFTLTAEDAEPLQVSGTRVSSSYFRVLGVQPVLGRAFTAEDDFFDEGANEASVILSEQLWRTRFGADPDILGRTMALDGVLWKVIGVMPDGLYPTRAPTQAALPLTRPARHVWVPLFLTEQWGDNRRSHVWAVIGRLREGVSIAAAQAEMDGIAAGLSDAYPEFNAGEGALVSSLHEEVVGDLRPALLVLLGAVGFVLLIACANAGGLLLARAAARGREVAIRAALGASRARIVRGSLLESLVLATVAGVAGVLAASWGVAAVRAAAPAGTPRLDEIAVDGVVLAFTAAVTLATGLLFGLVPSLRTAGPDLRAALQEGARGSSPGGERTRRALVLAEVTIAVVLVIGAGLMVRSFWNLARVEPGFDAEGVLDVTIGLSVQYADRPAVTGFYDELLQRIAALPGVVSVAAAYDTPPSASWSDAFRVAGRPDPDAAARSGAWLRIVTPEYFRTVGVRLLRGRSFDADDRAGAPGVAIVNESFARSHFPAEEALGQRLEFGTPSRMWSDGLSPEVFEIVGIVGDVRFLGLDRPPEPAFYVPFGQFPQWGMEVLVRTDGDPLARAPAVRQQVWEIDPDQPVARVATLRQLVDASLAPRRFNAWLLGLFGLTAVSLAAVGLYGLLANAVAQRTREIGVRIAIGARHTDVVRLVVGRGMLLVATGAALGVGGGLLLTRWMESLLFEVSALDPSIFALAVASLCLVALVACWLPARRAARVDPMVALRA